MQICVYCSSSSVVDPAYVSAAQSLGQAIAARGHVLVYGGANVGLMGELALSVKKRGGTVIGVLPVRLFREGLAFEEADELVVTETMAARKQAMEERSDAFLALPGGFGTLEELLQAMTLKQLGYLDGPIVLLNCGAEGSSERFYDPLLAFFEQLYHERFAKPAYRELYHIADTPAAALDHIEAYVVPDLPQKWF